MIYTDTHSHLYDEQLTTDDNIQDAINAGVTKMYMPNCDSTTIAGMMQLAEQYPNNCFPMMGVHPCYIKEKYKEELAIAAEQLAQHKFYAVGEIGLDYYWDVSFKAQQIEAFETQIDWALQYDLPIVIHSRESLQDCIDIVKKKQNGSLKGIFHCFGGSVEEAQQIIALGFYMGIGGVVTFKNSKLPEVLKDVDLSHLILETDAPYLAPTPFRGKRNESAYIPLIAEKLAEIKQVDVSVIAEATTANAAKIFGN